MCIIILSEASLAGIVAAESTAAATAWMGVGIILGFGGAVMGGLVLWKIA
jgi:hypothetical protein